MLMKLKKVFNALIFRSWIRKQLEKQQQVVLCTECLYLTGREGKGLCMSVNPRTYYLRVVQPLQMRWAWPESFLLTSAVTAFPCAGKERVKTQEVVWAIYFCQRVWQCEEAVREGGNRKMAASMSLLHSSFCGVSSLLLADVAAAVDLAQFSLWTGASRCADYCLLCQGTGIRLDKSIYGARGTLLISTSESDFQAAMKK